MEILFMCDTSNDLTGNEVGAIINSIIKWITEHDAKEELYFQLGSLRLYPMKVADDSDATPKSDGIELSIIVLDNHLDTMLAGMANFIEMFELRCNSERSLFVYGSFSYLENVIPSGRKDSNLREPYHTIGIHLTHKEIDALQSLSDAQDKNLDEYLTGIIKSLIKKRHQKE